MSRTEEIMSRRPSWWLDRVLTGLGLSSARDKAEQSSPESDDGRYICTRHEQTELVAYATLCHRAFVANGPQRAYKSLKECPDLPPSAWAIRDRIVARERLETSEAPALDDFISHISHGGAIHPHRDHNKGCLIHVRFNVFLQLPLQGGFPVYAGVRLTPREREYLPCVAGRDQHYCDMVLGPRARISLSFGFLVTPEWLQERAI